MKKTFIRTKNVKQFASLMDELQKLPPNIPKMALVYGEHGLGKSQTIQWWADKNDSVYVRATQGFIRNRRGAWRRGFLPFPRNFYIN